MGIFLGSVPAEAAPANLTRARYFYGRGDYPKAIIQYKKYLKYSPKDVQAWNELAAATYKVGLPRRALRYLRNVEKSTQFLSYNYYFQGLCYSMENSPERAKQYLAKAALYNDQFGANASFELGVMAINANQRTEAIQHLSRYLALQPRGTYARQAYAMLAVARDSSRELIPTIGHTHPDREQALYRYSKLSLFDYPHYWYMQLGYQNTFESEFQPSEGNTLSESSFLRQAIVANLGFGIGPIKQENVSGWLGYSYQQRYFTDSTRFDEYFDDWSDFGYQPFRMDLLQRKHILYGDVRRSFGDKFYLGLYGRLEFEYRGSQLLGSPDDQEIRKVFPISQGFILIPWVGYNWNENSRSLTYVYSRKLIQKDGPEFSNQTYYFSDESVPMQDRLSFGISHAYDIPKYDLELNAEVFRYSFTYNNQWLDYIRWGFILGGEHKILPKFDGNFFIGYYADTYKLDIPRVGPCARKLAGTAGGSLDVSNPTLCARNDQGFLVQGGFQWNYSPFHRLGAYVSFVKNSNAELQEYDNQKVEVKLIGTIAFPGVNRVLRFAERFGDSAFTKDHDN